MILFIYHLIYSSGSKYNFTVMNCDFHNFATSCSLPSIVSIPNFSLVACAGNSNYRYLKGSYAFRILSLKIHPSHLPSAFCMFIVVHSLYYRQNLFPECLYHVLYKYPCTDFGSIKGSTCFIANEFYP